MKIDWKRKLSSRKFWAAVSGVVISVMIIFNADSAMQERIAGAITATGTLMCYILAEGAADKAALQTKKSENEQ